MIDSGLGDKIDPIHCYDLDPTSKDILGKIIGHDLPLPDTFGPLQGDIMKIDPRILESPDGLVSGPPCPPWAGNGRKNPAEDERRKVFEQVLHMIEVFNRTGNLKFFVLENVAGLKCRYRGQPSMLSTVMERLRNMRPEFAVVSWDMNTKQYGLPHHRNRVYIVGIKCTVLRHQILPSAPPPAIPCVSLQSILTPGTPDTNLSCLTVRQRSNYKHYKAQVASMLTCPEHRGRTMCCDLNRKPTGSFGPKLRTDDCTETLRTPNNPLWIMSLGEGKRPRINRLLLIEERCRLQGFDSALFAHLRTGDVCRLMGNAFSVPVVGIVLRFCVQILITAMTNKKWPRDTLNSSPSTTEMTTRRWPRDTLNRSLNTIDMRGARDQKEPRCRSRSRGENPDRA